MKTAIEGGLIVAFNGEEHRLLRDGVVVVEDDKIIHVGKSYSQPVDETIDAKNKLVIPGLINLHSHISSSPFDKGFRGDGSSRALYNSDLYDRASAFWTSIRREDACVAAKFSLTELLKSGNTTIVEMGLVDALGPKEAVDLVGRMGIRAYLLKSHVSGRWYSPDGKKVCYENFDGEKWDEEQGFKQLRDCVNFIKEFDGSYNDRVRSFLYPAQVDTCSPSLLKETRKTANELHIRIETHVSQSVIEFKEIMQRYGRTPIEFLADVGLLGPDLIAGHAILIGGHSRVGYADPWRNDIILLSRSRTSVAHCPVVFARYGIAMESYNEYLRSGVNVGIGTDTFPQDMLREMRWASAIAKIVEGEPSVSTSKNVFESATISGAKALGRTDLGYIMPGAKADLVVIKLNTFNMCPVKDPIRNLVMNANNTDVDTVIVDGETIVKEGRVEGIDEAKLIEDLQNVAEKVWERVPQYDRIHRTADEIMQPSLKIWDAPW